MGVLCASNDSVHNCSVVLNVVNSLTLGYNGKSTHNVVQLCNWRNTLRIVHLFQYGTHNTR